MFFDILALVSLLFIIIIMKRFAGFLPTIVACLLWWKENINIDASLKTRRDRNIVALSMVLPFCLLISKFRLFELDFTDGLSEDVNIGITAGFFLGYMIIREVIAAGIQPRRINTNIWHAATTTEYTFFIPMTIILLGTGGILSISNVSYEVIKHAMFWISGAIYFVFLVRKLQIFSSSCNLFSAFLYLCALEILPTGVLITSAVIF